MVSVAQRICRRALLTAALAPGAFAAWPVTVQVPVVLGPAVVVAFAVSPVTAQAGQYHVYSCRTPAGEAAPADGWSGSVAPGGAYDDYTLNTCSQGGALVAALRSEERR